MADSAIKLRKVPESILKKRRQNLEAKAQRDTANALRDRAKRLRKSSTFKRAESFVKYTRRAERDDIRLRRETKKPDSLKKLPDAKLGFLIRICGLKGVPYFAKTVLNLLRLRHNSSGAFVTLNKTTMQLLKIVEPYITWGYPNIKIVRELIYKRGTGDANHKRVPLTDNALIEKRLGSKDIICVEDLVNEIFTAGKHFKPANDFLHHFQLNIPTGGWRKKSSNFKDGGDFGFRGEKINELLQRMI